MPRHGGDRAALDQLAGGELRRGAADRLDGGGGLVELGEGEEQAERRRRQRRQAQRRCGDHAEGPFGADQQLGQRVAGGVLAVAAAGGDQRAVG